MPPSPWGLPLETVRPRPWRAGSHVLGGDRPVIMGILNVTPDSFHDGGRFLSPDSALKRCESLLADGASVIDVGGESSRPGADSVDEGEEMGRVVPVIREITRRFSVPVSVDTVKSRVAERALDAGAVIINDISGMTFDPMMWELPQAYGAGVVLNHIRGTPRTMQQAPAYQDVVAEVKAFLKDRVQLLASLGLSKERIAVDPGIGFGKRPEDNYRLIDRLEALDDLGCPILLGVSRKSFIGKTPGLEASDRLQPSVALALMAALKGVSVLRVHDVKETAEALRMVEAVRKGG